MKKLKKNLQKGADKSGYENWNFDKVMNLVSEATMAEHVKNLSSNELMEAFFKAGRYYDEHFFFDDWMYETANRTMDAPRVCSKRKLL